VDKEKIAEYGRGYRKANKEKIAEYGREYRKAKKEERAKWRKEGERRAKIRATWARKYVKNYDAHVKAYTDAKAYDKATIELNAYYEENRKRYLEVIGARLKLGLGTIKKPYPEK
jgi:adenosine deaminase